MSGEGDRSVLVIGAAASSAVPSCGRSRTHAGASSGACAAVTASAAPPSSDLDRAETVAAAIAGVDLVVDPVPHPELTVERAVLRAGGGSIRRSPFERSYDDRRKGATEYT
jgi:hypothetical protein